MPFSIAILTFYTMRSVLAYTQACEKLCVYTIRYSYVDDHSDFSVYLLCSHYKSKSHTITRIHTQACARVSEKREQNQQQQQQDTNSFCAIPQIVCGTEVQSVR